MGDGVGTVPVYLITRHSALKTQENGVQNYLEAGGRDDRLGVGMDPAVAVAGAVVM